MVDEFQIANYRARRVLRAEGYVVLTLCRLCLKFYQKIDEVFEII